MKATLGISNRHIHLNEYSLETLFGKDYELSVRRQLSQPGEFSAEESVDIRVNNKTIENIRVVGPLRDYTQLELLKSDADYLGINIPVRKSGDLKNSGSVTIFNGENEITLDNIAIISARHIHMSEKDAQLYNFKDDEKVILVKDDMVIEDVFIKIKDNYKFEIHLDKDDAIKYNLENGDELEIKKEAEC